LKNLISEISKAVTGTYGQVLFSRSSRLACFILPASFFSPWIGFCGLIAALVSIAIGRILEVDRQLLTEGAYTFNALLAGLAIGANFEFGMVSLILVIAVSFFSLLFSSALQAMLRRAMLPYLSFPFVLSLWIIFLSLSFYGLSAYPALGLVPCTACNTVIGDFLSLSISRFLPGSLNLYFSSLSALFFQQTILPGLLIAIGLLIYSRIAFVLSFIGFFSGYLFYSLLPVVFAVQFKTIAFNYILLALGVGGFFLVPSLSSIVLVMLSVPLLAMLISAFEAVLLPFGLPVYSLPSSAYMVFVMALLHNRQIHRLLQPVVIQKFSPEKNLYSVTSYLERFGKETDVALHLPFFGTWTVSQSHDGKITHRESWKHALDFVVRDDHGRSFKLPGKQPADFYCYGLPVLAPADGKVVTLRDGIKDNPVGHSNLKENWGNTLVLQHTSNLYTKMSHLKPGSFRVQPGDLVKKGDTLALCGNSGRSPEPHLHFQVQENEIIGAPTIDYPLCYYVSKNGVGNVLHTYDVPGENESLSRPAPNQVLKDAFRFMPGMKFIFNITQAEVQNEETWEIKTNTYNNSYIECLEKQSKAYFRLDDALFCFTAFEGNENCLLKDFYLAAYRLFLGDDPDVIVKDKVSPDLVKKGPVKWLQDIVAPFYMFLKITFEAGITKSKDCFEITSTLNDRKKIIEEYKIVITEKGIVSFHVAAKCLTAEQIF
jgi:urea transporter/murein DD-endopeptidase MepM/ murein hydrolase activator NlpD